MALVVLGVADVGDPRGVECRDGLGDGAPLDLGGVAAVEQGLDGVRDVAQELRVLPARDVRARLRCEAAAGEHRGDLPRLVVEPVGIAADVECAGDRRGVGDHHPGLQMRRGQLHDHRVHTGEPAQRHALVLDAVLHAGHRDVGTRRGFEALERGGAVLALDRQQHDVVVLPGDLLGPLDDLDRHHEHAVGGFEAQPHPSNRVAVCAAGDQHDVMAVLEQPAADGPADRPRAVDDEPRHPAGPATRTRRARSGPCRGSARGSGGCPHRSAPTRG